MSKIITDKDKEEAIFRPQEFFSRPRDIWFEEGLSLSEKERALWTWKTDIKLQEIEIEESMAPQKVEGAKSSLGNEIMTNEKMTGDKRDLRPEKMMKSKGLPENGEKIDVACELEDVLREVHKLLHDSEIKHPSPSKLGGF